MGGLTGGAQDVAAHRVFFVMSPESPPMQSRRCTSVGRSGSSSPEISTLPRTTTAASGSKSHARKHDRGISSHGHRGDHSTADGDSARRGHGPNPRAAV